MSSEKNTSSSLAEEIATEKLPLPCDTPIDLSSISKELLDLRRRTASEIATLEAWGNLCWRKNLGAPRTPLKLKFYRNHPEALMPTKAYEGDACADLYAVEDTVLIPGKMCTIKTGLTCAHIPEGFSIVMRGRSGWGKMGVLIFNGEIDNGYRGELNIMAYLLPGMESLEINAYSKIAQMKLERIYSIPVVEASIEEITCTQRGTNGFGSSGFAATKGNENKAEPQKD